MFGTALDVADVEGLKATVARAQEKYGRVDCLVNHMGEMLLRLVEDQDHEAWEKMLDVNVASAMDAIQVLLDGMTARRRGTVINISFLPDERTFPDDDAYRSTKFAVTELSRKIRKRSAAHDLRLVSITPALAGTESLSHTRSDENKGDSWQKNMEGGIRAEDVARAISYAYNQPQNVCVCEIVLSPTGRGC